MKQPITINKVEVTLRQENIRKQFSFIQVTSDEKSVWNAIYLDRLLEYPVVEALVHVLESSFYLLVRQNYTEACQFVRAMVRENEVLSAEVLPLERIPLEIVTQLFINSLANARNTEYKLNNLSGKFYYSNPAWFLFKREGQQKKVFQIPACRFSVTKEMVLIAEICTFTSVVYRNLMMFQKTPFHKLPQYVFNYTTQTFRRKLPDENCVPEEVFIIRQIKGQKNNLKFIDFSSWEAFQKSKGAAWYHLIKLMDKHLSDYLTVDFERCDQLEYFPAKEWQNRYKQEQVRAFLDTHMVKILDDIRTDESSEYVYKLRDFITEQFETSALVTGKLETGDVCLRYIHNKENQEEENDSYREAGDYFTQGIIVHHITEEDFGCKIKVVLKDEVKQCSESGERKRMEQQISLLKSILSNVFKELLIKQDIVDKQITITDWKSYGFPGDWLFAWQEDKDNRICFMRVDPAGSFSFEIIHSDELSQGVSRYELYKSFFSSSGLSKSMRVEGLVQSPEGYVNLICKTTLRTLPAFVKIGDLLKAENQWWQIEKQLLIGLLDEYSTEHPEATDEIRNIIGVIEKDFRQILTRKELLGLTFVKPRQHKKLLSEIIFQKQGVILKNYLRSRVPKNELLNSNLDICYWEQEGKGWYFVGEKSKGIRTSFKDAANIRMIQPVDDSPLLFHDLIQTCNVDFVRHEGLTVLPFPFKYIREYLKIDRLKNGLE